MPSPGSNSNIPGNSFPNYNSQQNNQNFNFTMPQQEQYNFGGFGQQNIFGETYGNNYGGSYINNNFQQPQNNPGFDSFPPQQQNLGNTNTVNFGGFNGQQNNQNFNFTMPQQEQSNFGGFGAMSEGNGFGQGSNSNLPPNSFENYFRQQKNFGTNNGGSGGFSQQNTLTLKEAEQLINNLPLLLEKSVFETACIDPATLGNKIAQLSGHENKKLWQIDSPPGHNTKACTHNQTFADFAADYATSRLKGKSAVTTLNKLKTDQAIQDYTIQKDPNATKLEIPDYQIQENNIKYHTLNEAITAHEKYIKNEFNEQFASSLERHKNLLPLERVDADKFKTEIEQNFAGITWPIIYVKNGTLFRLNCSDFQSFLENGKYPEFPTAFIALLYQLENRTFIFDSSENNVIKNFREIAATYNARLCRTDSASKNSSCEINIQPDITQQAIDCMDHIQRTSHFNDYNCFKCYYRKSETSKPKEIDIYILRDYYRQKSANHFTVKRFVVYLGIFAEKLYKFINKLKQSLTTIGSEDYIYDKYKYLEEILTDYDKEQIECQKVSLSKSTNTDKSNDSNKTHKDFKAEVVKSILDIANLRFNKKFDEDNLARKGFGRKFFKTVEENVEIDGLKTLIDNIYTAADFNKSIFNNVKKISDLKKIVNNHITSDRIGLSAKGLCLMGTTYAFADCCHEGKDRQKVKDIVNKLPKTIKNLDRTGLRHMTLKKHVGRITTLTQKVTKKYWGDN